MLSIFCNNCGDRGHAFRECRKPVLSCGIIIVRDKTKPTESAQLPIKSENIEVLMIRRKDSMSYTEFIRGKYDPSDKNYVKRLLSNMTSDEIAELKSVPFEQLWAKMWNFADRHEYEMPYARDKFALVTDVIKEAESEYVEPEWGFPKGRRYRCESDIQCAEREFFEETNFPRSSYVVVKDVEFNETFVGTNGTPYQHKYFMAVLARPAEMDIEQKFTAVQKREISAIDWKTLDECIQLTRPHYSGRRQMIQDLSKFVAAVEVRIPNFVGEDNGVAGSRFTT